MTSKILLAEDNPADSMLFEISLAEDGENCTVIVVQDGGQALSALQESEELPDLVVLDFNLPRLDALEVLAALRKNPRFDALNVVVLSSLASPRDIERAHLLGARYEIKPADLDQYTALVRRLTSNLSERRVGKAEKER